MSPIVQALINGAIAAVRGRLARLGEESEVIKAHAEDLVNDSALLLEHVILGIKTESELEELRALLAARRNALLAVSSMTIVDAADDAVTEAIRDVIAGAIRP